jgi:alpha-glucosidase
MTREGILGLEHRNMQGVAATQHDTPFTRMLAGHADYTVMHFGDRRRDTLWAHQIASAVILTSPFAGLRRASEGTSLPTLRSN